MFGEKKSLVEHHEKSPPLIIKHGGGGGDQAVGFCLSQGHWELVERRMGSIKYQ